MIEIIQKQNEELQKIIYKVPALITLYVASQVAEGHLVPAEEKSARIYLSILCNQANESLKDYFIKVKESFINDIEMLDKELPKDSDKRKEKIEQLLKPVKTFLYQIPDPTGILFKDALLGFVSHARDYRQDTLEGVVFPFVSDELRRIEDKRLRRILG